MVIVARREGRVRRCRTTSCGRGRDVRCHGRLNGVPDGAIMEGVVPSPGADQAFSPGPLSPGVSHRLPEPPSAIGRDLEQVHTVMRRHRVGLWLVGAFGGVGTTITLGLSAMARGLADRTGLVSELPLFRGLSLVEPDGLVVGGHEIRETTFRESAEEFRRSSGVFPADWIEACGEDLDAATARVRPGTTLGAGPAVARLANWAEAGATRTVLEAVDRAAADMAAFVDAESIGHMIVLNVSSTEPPFATAPVHRHW